MEERADLDVQDEMGTNNSVRNDNGPNGGAPSMGVSIDLSSLVRPPSRPSLSTFTLAWDPFTQSVGPKQP